MVGPSSLLQVIHRLGQSLYSQPTLSASQVKLLFREPGVKAGYRPTNKPWTFYILSAFQLNNETVNIWTHLLAAAVFIHRFFIVDTFDGNTNAWPFVSFGIASTVCVLVSSFAHLFHSKSPHLHYLCFQLDYIVIGLGNISSNTLLLYTCSPDWLYANLRPYVSVLNVALGMIFVIGCSLAKLKYQRPYPPERKFIQLVSGSLCVLPSILILLSRLGSCVTDTECSMTSLSHHGRWTSSLVLCLFFFSSHLPEKLYPGMFDVVGQGHQVFHIFQAASRILQFEAGHIDLLDNDMANSKLEDSSLVDELATYMVYIVGCMAIVLSLKSTVNSRIRIDAKIE